MATTPRHNNLRAGVVLGKQTVATKRLTTPAFAGEGWFHRCARALPAGLAQTIGPSNRSGVVGQLHLIAATQSVARKAVERCRKLPVVALQAESIEVMD